MLAMICLVRFFVPAILEFETNLIKNTFICLEILIIFVMVFKMSKLEYASYQNLKIERIILITVYLISVDEIGWILYYYSHLGHIDRFVFLLGIVNSCQIMLNSLSLHERKDKEIPKYLDEEEELTFMLK